MISEHSITKSLYTMREILFLSCKSAIKFGNCVKQKTI
uniref:Uncharacterized protein n=1 Tax=Rhizophora mucronata TaxID=61149 RepID=A0A2P2JIE7_RHIMU